MRTTRLLALLTLVFTACGGGTKLPPAAEFPAVGQPARVRAIDGVPVPAGARVLRWKAAKGQKAHSRMDFTIGVIASGAGIPTQDIHIGMNFEGDSEITEVRPDQSYNLQFTVSDASVSLSGIPGADPSALGDVGSSLKGTVLAFLYDAQGRMLEDKTPDNPLLDQGNGGMEQTFDNLSVPWPEGPVGPGSKWEALMTSNMNGATARVLASYELLALDGDKGKVAVTLAAEGRDQVMKLPTMAADADLKSLKIAGKGIYTFDLGQPNLIAVELDMKMETDLTIHALGESADVFMTTNVKVAVGGPKTK